MNFRSIWLILSSVFFGVAGVYCFFHPQDSLVAAGLYIGFLMFFSGISQLLRYFTETAVIRSRWQLFVAIIDLLFGLWLLASGNFVFLAAFLPLFFAAYMAVRGVFLLIFYFRRKELITRPGVYLAAAAGQIVLGGILLAQPLLAAYTFIYAVGIGLLWCGFSTFYTWREMGSENV